MGVVGVNGTEGMLLESVVDLGQDSTAGQLPMRIHGVLSVLLAQKLALGVGVLSLPNPSVAEDRFSASGESSVEGSTPPAAAVTDGPVKESTLPGLSLPVL